MNAQSNEERIVRLETTLEHLATKADLETSVGAVRVDLAKLEVRIMRMLMVQTIALLGAMVALATYLKT